MIPYKIEGLLNAYEIASELQVTHTTVYDWVKEGMPYIKVAKGKQHYMKFDLKECQEWLKIKREELKC